MRLVAGERRSGLVGERGGDEPLGPRRPGLGTGCEQEAAAEPPTGFQQLVVALMGLGVVAVCMARRSSSGNPDPPPRREPAHGSSTNRSTSSGRPAMTITVPYVSTVSMSACVYVFGLSG